MSMRCYGVHDLAAAEAQYYVRCYNSFRKIPRMRTEQVVAIEDETLLKLIDEMFANRKLGTWTTIDLHDKYTCYGGKLTHKQMLSKLVTHLRDENVVLKIDGCASVIGFQEFLGKILKVAKVASEDDEMEDTLVQKIVTEASKYHQTRITILMSFPTLKLRNKLVRHCSDLFPNLYQMVKLQSHL